MLPLRRRRRSRAALALPLLAAALLAPPAAAQPPGAPHTFDAREQTADQQVWHALNRLAFGPRPGDVARVRAMGVDAWIAAQLAPERLPDAPGDAVAAAHPLLRLALPQLLAEHPPAPVLRALAGRGAGGAAGGDSAAARDAAEQARRATRAVAAELQAMRVARAVASERQLEEVLVDFWENHFSVFAGKGPLMRHYLVAYDRDAVRPHVLGRFRDLLGAVVRSPAMLTYLDNAQSVAAADAPTPLPPAQARRVAERRRAAPAARARGLNENFARELLELHTLGAGGGYTQQDVVEVARAFTGWSVERPTAGGDFVFRPALHDAGPKTVLGARLPAGRGLEDGEQVLDLLSRHPATARHVAAKLVRRLVHDEPPPALVERAAATFRRTDGDLRAVVRTIVTAPEFFAASAYRAKVKSPFELVVSAARALGAAPDATPRTALLVARLGQPLYGHQAPDGWPETGAPWLTSGAIVARIDAGLAIAGGAVPGASLDRWPPAAALRAAPRARQVDAAVAELLGGAASPDTRALLASGDHPLRPADARPADARPAFGARAARGGLAEVVGLAIGAPEFQRR